MSDTFVALLFMSGFAFVGIVVLGLITTNSRPRIRLPKGPAGPPRSFWWDDDYMEELTSNELRHAPRVVRVRANVGRATDSHVYHARTRRPQ